MKTRQWRPAPPERTVREAQRARNLLLLVALLVTLPAKAITITFGETATVTPGSLGDLDATAVYHEAGFTITSQGSPSTGFGRWDFYGGAIHSCRSGFSHCAFTITEDDGGAFNLDGFDAMTTLFDYCRGFAPPVHSGFTIGRYAVDNCDNYARISAGVGPVTSLTLSATAGDALLVDNLVLSPIAAAPEPETWALLLLGLGLVGTIARRRP